MGSQAGSGENYAFFLKSLLVGDRCLWCGKDGRPGRFRDIQIGCQPFIRRLLVNCVMIDNTLAIALDADNRPPQTLSGGKADSRGQCGIYIGPVTMGGSPPLDRDLQDAVSVGDGAMEDNQSAHQAGHH